MSLSGSSCLGLGAIAVALFASPSFAGVPECPAYGRDLPVDNSQVLHWKRTTPNQFRERAHVSGVLLRLFPDRNGHEHFEIQIGSQPGDTIEVVYNQEFGALPERLVPGMAVEACGDYITATAPTQPTPTAPNGYPASPSGAIIHWLHANPRGRGHDPGFVIIDQVLFGQMIGQSGPRRGRIRDSRRERALFDFAGADRYPGKGDYDHSWETDNDWR
ncbi:MAG: DUF3465 domain-containing protein [Oligoflexia bacterium]|nr:DUF3465 domain-containing protein [Oligoflexia bacterium]